MKVVTTQMRPGYLRHNGVPYSANAVMTEYFDRLEVPGGDTLLLMAAEIADAETLGRLSRRAPVQAAGRSERLQSDTCAAR